MKDRVALVTGAGRGIGRAIALELAAAGAHVAISARSQSELDAVRQEITSAGGQVFAACSDLADRTAPARLVDQVREQFGPIEILVNNAGVGSSQDPKPLVDFD